MDKDYQILRHDAMKSHTKSKMNQRTDCITSTFTVMIPSLSTLHFCPEEGHSTLP